VAVDVNFVSLVISWATKSQSQIFSAFSKVHETSKNQISHWYYEPLQSY